MNALVIGGSRGVGAGIVGQLLAQGYKRIYIFDKNEPLIYDNRIVFIHNNLSNQEFEDLKLIKNDVDAVFVTAGIGRLCLFDEIKTEEIDWMFKINALTPIKVVKLFYDRIASKSDFYFGIMSSIAGRISSPFYALYSATKASVSRFVESVNIELEKSGYKNRILECSPGSIKGTCFHGGVTDLDKVEDISKQIVEKTFARETLFIPEYDSVFKNVIDRYNADSHKFGLESYEYKLDSATLEKKPKMKIGYLSGTFDMFHIGHLNLIRQAKKYCDFLIVGVHRDASHKGKTVIIPYENRCEILRSCKYVDMVVESQKEDSEAYEIYHYDMLFVGSDYKNTPRFQAYEKYFENTDVKIIYFDYTQGISSSDLREKIKELENAENN